ncbi:hypothetical protein Bpfe_009621 [Biomphalaria pfeifferi]|uniref:Uncharacterized protein n=1 Tax=Biomphalaria pfeifferi TaxID=112525 RepID=A0AAD8BUW4_BIOPF|nr:hypothetical protein Bpfe_009621 [Biomphalaria pfeifferi]
MGVASDTVLELDEVCPLTIKLQRPLTKFPRPLPLHVMSFSPFSASSVSHCVVQCYCHRIHILRPHLRFVKYDIGAARILADIDITQTKRRQHMDTEA